MSAISSHIRNIEIHRIRSRFATNFYGSGTSQFSRQCEPSRATPGPSTTPTTITMEFNALIDHNDIHTSPTAERFYRIQLARQQRPHWHLNAHRAPELPREQNIRTRALREDAHMSCAATREATGASDKQIQYALTTPLTPRTNRRGRKPSRFTDEEKDHITRPLNDDTIARKLSWLDLKLYLEGSEHWTDTGFTTAMRAAGFSRQVPPRRIKLTAQYRAERLAFVREQLALRTRPEDWEHLAFSNEARATNDPM
ncbi:uncharacterized protein QC763_0074200 [Podospora pseudopauciseta]|uniref:Transposase Tc1-like domain-containing protein n=1 Tax=Podospora pseudopauciseta TaxID=2093780 RepID=A0ABR0H9N1_9PEZI|nr:hypothetical protein QC763_0074200 [Podospora pseudopauciseta]